MVKAHDLSKQEKDTYDIIPVYEKQALSIEAVKEHWDTRAKRPGVQAVMSARHSLEENIQATNLLRQDIFKFLEGHIEDKRIFELGIGIGRMTSELAKRAREVYGNDFSKEMIAQAIKNLNGAPNVKLFYGPIYDLGLKGKSFDLVFETIVLLHILDSEELQRTANTMKELSDKIFLCEHTYEGPDFPTSKYTILRKPEEYAALFKPYELVKLKEHSCAGDRFTLMLFEEI